MVCYRWLIWSNCLSHTVFETLISKILWSRPWPNMMSSVTWSLDSQCRVPIGGQFEPTIYLTRFFEILSFKDIGVTWRHRVGHVTIGAWPCAKCDFLLVVNMNQRCILHGCWDIELQRFWSHDPGVTWRHQSRDHWTPDMQFPTGGPLKPLLYLASLLRYYVSNTAKHIPIENALISIFCVLGGKIGGYSILQLCACSRSLGTSFELLTPTISPRASLLQYWDLPIEKALRRWKTGKIGVGVIGFWPLTKAFLLFGAPTSVQNFIKTTKIATVGARTDWQTGASGFIICPMLCYSNGTMTMDVNNQSNKRRQPSADYMSNDIYCLHKVAATVTQLSLSSLSNILKVNFV